jgi:hypothetical protein
MIRTAIISVAASFALVSVIGGECQLLAQSGHGRLGIIAMQLNPWTSFCGSKI